MAETVQSAGPGSSYIASSSGMSAFTALVVMGRRVSIWIVIEVVIIMSVGCDGVVGSDKKIDQCGMCGGNNSTCKIVSGLYTRPTLPVGYNLIAKLPPGACNINITELRYSKNYLALRIQNGKYIINGNWAINWSGTYDAAGTTFVYRRHDSRTQLGEQIVAKGPISETIDVLVIYQQPNHGIKYEYSLAVTSLRHNPSRGTTISTTASLPFRETNRYSSHDESYNESSKKDHKRKHRHNGKNHDRKLSDAEEKTNMTMTTTRNPSRRHRGEYRWRVMGFSECSATCGGGTQRTIVVCVKRKLLTIVDRARCRDLLEPSVQTVRCNTTPCPARWITEAWSSCSSTCGEGTQTRSVTCKQDISPRLQIQVADSSCYGLEKPQSSQPCNLTPCSQWKAGNWTECSVECGRGIRKREVQCVSTSGESLSESGCGTEKPEMEQICDMGICKKMWFYSPWTDTCSVECGTGIQTRLVICSQGNKSENSECNTKNRPVSQKRCTSTKGCGAKWFAGPWSQCSSRCGHGTKTRNVICLFYADRLWKSTFDEDCQNQEKPTEELACSLKPCGPEWVMTDWSQCSKTCGTGTQVREVMCSSQGDGRHCYPEAKPPIRQACNTQPCPIKKDTQCSDNYLNCKLVVRARLCSYPYYRNLCCISCSEIT